jgi:hypothetical protein
MENVTERTENVTEKAENLAEIQEDISEMPRNLTEATVRTKNKPDSITEEVLGIKKETYRL